MTMSVIVRTDSKIIHRFESIKIYYTLLPFAKLVSVSPLSNLDKRFCFDRQLFVIRRKSPIRESFDELVPFSTNLQNTSPPHVFMTDSHHSLTCYNILLCRSSLWLNFQQVVNVKVTSYPMLP